MCDVVQTARSTFYYETKEQTNEDDVTEAIADIFHKNRKAYGTPKIKVKLQERGFVFSRRRIGRIMKAQRLVSTYTVAQYKPLMATCNEASTAKRLHREFKQWCTSLLRTFRECDRRVDFYGKMDYTHPIDDEGCMIENRLYDVHLWQEAS